MGVEAECLPTDTAGWEGCQNQFVLVYHQTGMANTRPVTVIGANPLHPLVLIRWRPA